MMSSEMLDGLDWSVETEHEGERIDKYITDVIEEEISRSQVQQWIKEGRVTVNGKSIKPNHRLMLEDMVHLIVPDPVELDVLAENISLEVVYEDEDVIVVNKPRGMVVHPAPGHISGTLVNALLYHCKDLSGINGVLRPGIVHRIDKDTSGLLMVAKNDKAHIALSAQLKAHTVTRKYLAVVHDQVMHDQGTVDAPIGRSNQDRKMFMVKEKSSKDAITHFVVLERFPNATLLELRLETGRTHQIRVHMKFIGHPLVGDPMYGRAKGITMEGQALHATILGFKHPRTGQYLEFSAPIPADMEHLLYQLRSL